MTTNIEKEEDSIKKKNIELSGDKAILILMNEKLSIEYEKMTDIKNWQYAYTSSRRENEIELENNVIHAMRRDSTILANKVQTLQNR